MNIGIIGSWHFSEKGIDWRFKETKESFSAACEELGGVLARQGYTIIVGSESTWTADVPVVKGYFEVAKLRSGKAAHIEVLRPDDGKKPFRKLAESHDIVRYPPVERKDWRATHLKIVYEADVILTIGGRDKTYLAGLAANLAAKPLIAIGAFGGASEKLLKDLELAQIREELVDLNNWNSEKPSRIIELLDKVESEMAEPSAKSPSTAIGGHMPLRELFSILTVRQFWTLVSIAAASLVAVGSVAYSIGEAIGKLPSP